MSRFRSTSGTRVIVPDGATGIDLAQTLGVICTAEAEVRAAAAIGCLLADLFDEKGMR